MEQLGTSEISHLVYWNDYKASLRVNKIVASSKYLAPLLWDHISRPYASRHINSLVTSRP